MARHDGSPSPPAEPPESSGSWELSGYAFEALRQDGGLVLYRACRDGQPGSVLVVAPAGEGGSAAALGRLEHEFLLTRAAAERGGGPAPGPGAP